MNGKLLNLEMSISSALLKYIGKYQDDSALRIFGFLLSLVHVFTGIIWLAQDSEQYMVKNTEVICWPWLTICENFRLEYIESAWWIILCYIFTSIFVAFLFLNRRLVPLALTGFLLVLIYKFGILSFDYTFRHNSHYMHFFISIAFLMPFAQRDFCKWQIAFFYFWAGTLKLNFEWFSGAAIYKLPYLISKDFLPLAAVYVVILELFLVWGLFSKKNWIYWGVLSQLIIFHLVSFRSVGPLYPLTMFLILAVLFVDKLIPKKQSLNGLHIFYFSAYFIFFGVLQLVPVFRSENASLTGEGRLLALHMFDAKPECHAFLTGPNGEAEDLVSERDVYRVKCDPIVINSRVKNRCSKSNKTNLDLIFISKRSGDQAFRKIIDINNICDQEIAYSVLFKNDWIKLDTYQTKEIVLATTGSELWMGPILRNLAQHLEHRLDVKLLFGADNEKIKGLEKKNIVWVTNDVLFKRKNENVIDAEGLEPKIFLGHFPFVLLGSDKSFLKKWEDIIHGSKKGKTFNIAINQNHPLGAIFFPRMAEKFNIKLKTVPVKNLTDQFFKMNFTNDLDLAIVPSLFILSLNEYDYVNILATSFTTESTKDFFDLETGLGREEFGTSLLIYWNAASPPDQEILNIFSNAIQSPSFSLMLSKFSNQKLSMSPEVIKVHSDANLKLYEKYKSFIK